MLDQPHQSIDLSIEPLDDFVVVQPAEGEAETRGGLIIPASAETPCRSGIVTAVGPDVNGIEPGDKVLYPREAGYEIRMAGTSVRVLKREELIARVHD
ncbi:MAG TPA: co-chaperone GroES [Gaiellaceae bacterium]|nr:co-chaperone GroES [Gaiellaceae bacterium]